MSKKSDMREGMSHITLVVPIYNEAPYLERCLESIRRQTVPFNEVILVDDGSTDGSQDIASKYGLLHGWQVITHEENMGVSASRNDGIESTTGDYIAFLDSDDVLHPNAHERMVEGANTGRNVLQFNHYRKYEARLNPIMKWIVAPRAYSLKKDGHSGLPFCWYMVWNKLYKKSAIKHLFDTSLQYGEDEIFNLRLLLDDEGIHQVEEQQGTVIRHFENKQSLNHSKDLHSIEEQDRALNEILAEITEAGAEQYKIDALKELIAEHRGSATYQRLGWKGEE